jgi:hypothetical protein
MKPTKKPPREPTKMINFRLEPSLIARLDAHAERMTAATPGVTFSRIDALRTLLVPALDAVERRQPRKKS